MSEEPETEQPQDEGENAPSEENRRLLVVGSQGACYVGQATVPTDGTPPIIPFKLEEAYEVHPQHMLSKSNLGSPQFQSIAVVTMPNAMLLVGEPVEAMWFYAADWAYFPNKEQAGKIMAKIQAGVGPPKSEGSKSDSPILTP